MSLNKEALDKLIMEEISKLDEKFSKDDWDHVFGLNKNIGTIDSDKLTKFNKTKMPPEDVWNKLKDAGDNPNLLDITDIKYYKENPDKIDPQVQSRLIAVSRAGAGGDETKYAAMVADVKANGEELASTKTQNKVTFPNPPIDAEGERISFGKGHGFNKYQTYRQKYLKLTDENTKQMLLKMAAEAELALAALNTAQTKAAGEEKTVSYPSIRTQAGETGSFPKGQLAVVNRLFSKFNTIEDRINELTRISTKYYKASTAEPVQENEDAEMTSASALQELKNDFLKEPSKIFNEIMILDVFNTLVKDTDSGSGAYTFEYFLALVTGGTVAGKMKTAGGKMGAADFIMGDQLGSAKFFKDDTGHNIKQAVSGFADLYDSKTNEPVKIRYSIGLKKQGMTQIGKPSLGTTDPNKIIAVEVFTPEVSYHGTEGFKINGIQAKVKDGSVLIPTAGLESNGIMYICRTRTETFRQMLDDVMLKISDDASSLFEAFKNYFDSLREANQSAKVYIANGEVDAGNKVYDSLSTAETNFSKVKAGIEGKGSPLKNSQDYYQQQYNDSADFVEENKKNEINSLKALDKLIERVILYKNTEEK